jgi:hypothetical protein
MCAFVFVYVRQNVSGILRGIVFFQLARSMGHGIRNNNKDQNRIKKRTCMEACNNEHNSKRVPSVFEQEPNERKKRERMKRDFLEKKKKKPFLVSFVAFPPSFLL